MELVTTDENVAARYHPSLVWIDVSSVEGAALGWRYDGARWSEPEEVSAAPEMPSLVELQSHLAIISAQIAALSGQG